MKELKENAIDTVTEISGSTAGALAGAGIGMAVAGPLGIVGGAAIGPVVERIFKSIGEEIKERYLSKSEYRKLNSVYNSAIKVINQKISQGKVLREDDFFSDSMNQRSSAEEIMEATLFAAQRECEEKKIPYMANLYANIVFDSSIDRQMANQLIKVASEITYRQLVIIGIIREYQIGFLSEPERLNEPYDCIKGSKNISIASEIMDLYRRSLVFSKEAIYDAAGFTPFLLEINGIGKILFDLMELHSLDKDDIAKDIIALLSGNNLEESSEIIETGKSTAVFG